MASKDKNMTPFSGAGKFDLSNNLACHADVTCTGMRGFLIICGLVDNNERQQVLSLPIIVRDKVVRESATFPLHLKGISDQLGSLARLIFRGAFFIYRVRV